MVTWVGRRLSRDCQERRRPTSGRPTRSSPCQNGYTTCATAGPGLCQQRLSNRRRGEQPKHQLLHELVDGIGDDPQLMPGATFGAQIAPRAVARPGEQGGPAAPAVDQAGEQVAAGFPDVGVALGVEKHRSYLVWRSRAAAQTAGLKSPSVLPLGSTPCSRSPAIREDNSTLRSVGAPQGQPEAPGTPRRFQSRAIVIRPWPMSTRLAASRTSFSSSSLRTPHPSWRACPTPRARGACVARARAVLGLLAGDGPTMRADSRPSGVVRS